MDQARVVVIGGGITGCSVAYHLAEAGWTDVLLVEKAQLTAGSTCQAAGLVTVFNPSATMMRFRRYSVELYERLGVFERSGSLRLASSPDQLRELERTASRARGIGLDAEVVSADEARRRMPAISPDDLYGAVYLAQDGHLDPHARDPRRRRRGPCARGPDPDGHAGHRDRARRPARGQPGHHRPRPDRHGAGRRRGRDLGAPGRGDGRRVHPVDAGRSPAHRAAGGPGSRAARDMPCFRDPDNLVYGKSEHGGMVFGGYEAEPAARWIDGVPWDHAATSLAPDYERFAPLMAGAVRRFPFLADAEVIRLVCHPDAMTPDANPLLGPLPGIHGFWVAAGLSLNGFGGGGGIGRAMAGWITAGDPDVDVVPYRAWRFADPYRDPSWSAALAREAYADYYRLRYPYDADEAGRPRRLSALHGRLQDTGAAFVAKAGWERADVHRPGRPWRRVGRDQRAYGWTRPPWFERVGEEHRAVRERVGTDRPVVVRQDRGSRTGRPRAPPARLRQRHRPTRRCRGLQAGARRARRDARRRDRDPLGRHAFRVVTGAGSVAGDLGWLVANRRDDEPEVDVQDVSEAWACLGLWGPAARTSSAAAPAIPSTTPRSRSARAVPIRVGPAPVLASRISYAGELGWELYVARDWAAAVWDRAGRRRAWPSASSRSATGPSSACGSRRATATSGRT